ncbi:hypothetical protein B0T09DRAFT_407371 [Sordaria sp. MPI-SDFR-AT-0083]|nr:hypothetical protein B0T09DRAFT_407371 [Sordaria sp. MPI-SDFR-AT-0083]
MHLTTVVSPLVLVMAGLTVAATVDDFHKGPKHPKGHKDHGASSAHCRDGCHDAFSGLLEVAATHTLGPVTRAARAMAASVPDDQIKLAARSVKDEYKCASKHTQTKEICPSNETACYTVEELHFVWQIREECDKIPEFSDVFNNATSTVTKGQLNGDHKCIWKNTRHYELCPSNNTPCSNKESKDVYYSAEGCDKDPDFIAIFGRISDAASDRPSTVNEASSIKVNDTPGTLQARAVATPNAWDDLGPVTFRTERPEMAVHEIDPRSVSTTTTMGRETTTYATTTTEEIDVMSVIVITDTTSTPSTTTTTSTSSVPTGPPMTTISNIKPGSNTFQMPAQSAPPVVVIVAPSESYSVARTVETLWSSVMQPVNIATATVTRDVSLLIPAQAATSTAKANGASTMQSGAGFTVMAGVGALAACFMMF